MGFRDVGVGGGGIIASLIGKDGPTIVFYPAKRWDFVVPLHSFWASWLLDCVVVVVYLRRAGSVPDVCV